MANASGPPPDAATAGVPRPLRGRRRLRCHHLAVGRPAGLIPVVGRSPCATRRAGPPERTHPTTCARPSAHLEQLLVEVLPRQGGRRQPAPQRLAESLVRRKGAGQGIGSLLSSSETI